MLGHNASTFSSRALTLAVVSLVDTLRAGRPGVPIAVSTPIASPERERRRNLHGQTLAGVRDEIRAAVRLLQDAEDEHLHLVDGLAVLSEDEGQLLPDGLHPGPRGYPLMPDPMERVLRKIVES